MMCGNFRKSLMLDNVRAHKHRPQCCSMPHTQLTSAPSTLPSVSLSTISQACATALFPPCTSRSVLVRICLRRDAYSLHQTCARTFSGPSPTEDDLNSRCVYTRTHHTRIPTSTEDRVGLTSACSATERSYLETWSRPYAENWHREL